MITWRPHGYALIAILITTVLWYTQILGTPIGGRNDFDQTWLAARTLLQGADPYAVIRPNGPQGTPYPLYYPLTTAIVSLPLGAASLEVARYLFLALSAGTLGFVIGAKRPWMWPLLLSIPFMIAVRSSQWSLLLTAAMILPSLGFLAVAKPNLGLAMLARCESRRSVLLLVGGGLGVLVLSLVADWGWPFKWRDALAGAPHFRPLLLRPGGILMLLGLWKWRDPDARMLVALALVPQTGLAYEALPALTVARTRVEAAGLALLTHLAWNLGPLLPPLEGFQAETWWAGTVNLWLILAPALALVLLRDPVSAPSKAP